eukprot:353161-Chlamydomonas_euryale.AAC.3
MELWNYEWNTSRNPAWNLAHVIMWHVACRVAWHAACIAACHVACHAASRQCMCGCVRQCDDPELVSVVMNVQEKNWYKLHAATYVQVRLGHSDEEMVQIRPLGIGKGWCWHARCSTSAGMVKCEGPAVAVAGLANVAVVGVANVAVVGVANVAVVGVANGVQPFLTGSRGFDDSSLEVLVPEKPT